MSGSWAIYVPQISINTTTYHHSIFQKISARFESPVTELNSPTLYSAKTTTKRNASCHPRRLSQFERDRTCAETRFSTQHT